MIVRKWWSEQLARLLKSIPLTSVLLGYFWRFAKRVPLKAMLVLQHLKLRCASRLRYLRCARFARYIRRNSLNFDDALVLVAAHVSSPAKARNYYGLPVLPEHQCVTGPLAIDTRDLAEKPERAEIWG